MKPTYTRKVFIISMILLFTGVALAFADHHGRQDAQTSRTGLMASDQSPGRIYVFGTDGQDATAGMDQAQHKGAGMATTHLSSGENDSQVYVFGTTAHGRKNAMAAQGSMGLTKVYHQNRWPSPGRIYVEGTDGHASDADRGEVH